MTAPEMEKAVEAAAHDIRARAKTGNLYGYGGQDLSEWDINDIAKSVITAALASPPPSAPPHSQASGEVVEALADAIEQLDTLARSQHFDYSWGDYVEPEDITKLRAALSRASQAPQDAPPRSGEGWQTALREIYEWYDRDGSVGGASIIFEKHRGLLPAAPLVAEPGE